MRSGKMIFLRGRSRPVRGSAVNWTPMERQAGLAADAGERADYRPSDVEPPRSGDTVRVTALRANKHPSASNRSSLPPGKRSVSVHRLSAAFQVGFRIGRKDARCSSLRREPYRKKALNLHWLQHTWARRWARRPWSRYTDAATGYVHGYFRAKGKRPHDWLLLPTTKTVAAIVSVMNEEATIGRIMRQLNRLPFNEVIVIVNGSTDRSFQKAREGTHAIVLSYPQQLGHDVGRALGAKLAQSDILLFLDGDILLTAEELIPFVGGIEKGLDVALNNISPYLRIFSRRDQVTYMKQFLNASLGRPDLDANSLTAVPHALSRKAVETLGISSLIVPPKALALAMHHGLRIGTSGSVNVIRTNKRREHNTGRRNRVADLIVGDHFEALKLAYELAGERLSFADTMRNRSALEVKSDAIDEHHHS